MDFDIEVSFVKDCIKKDFQDRIIYELKSKKHREKAKSRFAHSSENMLKECFKKLILYDLESSINTNNSNTCCYVIGDLFDGEVILLKNAIEYLKKTYTPVILIDSRFVVIKEEVEKNEPILWIYKKIIFKAYKLSYIIFKIK